MVKKKLHWTHNLKGDEWQLEYWPFIFDVEFSEYWIKQWQVFISSKYFDSGENVIYLNYMADEFGWYEKAEWAIEAVECFIINELNNKDFLLFNS